MTFLRMILGLLHPNANDKGGVKGGEREGGGERESECPEREREREENDASQSNKANLYSLLNEASPHRYNIGSSHLQSESNQRIS